MKKKKIELVCPAGNWESLRTAVDSGADSVYFGIKGFNMRNLAGNFDILELPKLMEYLHSNNKKGYLALNVIIMNNELTKVERILQEAKKAKVDAIILWDMAVFSIAKKLGLKIHLSTQASVSNTAALLHFVELDVKRVVLARECTLDQIKEITSFLQKQKLSCEIETFIHGAMCISVSGRCFLSQYSHNMSANRGECIQPCRREYDIKDTSQGQSYSIGSDYVLSPKDLCTIDFLDQLLNSGISSFKIEGRKRSPEYIRVVTTAYRKAIDAFCEGKLTNELKNDLKKELGVVYNRGFSSGFYFGQPEEWESRKLEHTHQKVYLGCVVKFYKKLSVAEIIVKNESLQKGDILLFVGKHTPAQFVTAGEIQQQHLFVDKVNKDERAGIKTSFIVRNKDKVFLWRVK